MKYTTSPERCKKTIDENVFSHYCILFCHTTLPDTFYSRYIIVDYIEKLQSQANRRNPYLCNRNTFARPVEGNYLTDHETIGLTPSKQHLEFL